MRRLAICILAAFPLVAAGTLVRAQGRPGAEVPFVIADSAWDSETLGNHRAVLHVGEPGRVARALIPWRRRDRHPEERGVIVTDAAGRPIDNVRRGAFTQAAGELDFEPTAGPGRYLVYYLPYRSGGRSNYPNVTYLPVRNTADPAWLESAGRGTPVRAAVTRIEAVDSLNGVDPMEVVATADEVAAMVAAHPGRPLLVFPEDRLHPVKMFDQLPIRWVDRGPGGNLTLEGRRGEFVAFQLGVFAVAAVEDLRVTVTALAGPGGAVIPAGRVTTFNTGGTGWDGRPFVTRVDVPAGRVQSMWSGVDLPAAAAPGTYRGTATVTARGATPVPVPVSLTVGPTLAADGGAGEPWLQTRLKWLNSTLGQTNDVIAPYRPLMVAGRTIRLLGRDVVLGRSGLPARIDTYFTPEMTGYGPKPNPVLAAPIRFEVAGAGDLVPGEVRFTRRDPGQVEWRASAANAAASLGVAGTLEFDGYLRYRLVLVARQRITADDIRLLIPLRPAAAEYLMGLGFKGQRRPVRVDWRWDVARKNQDGAWIGGVNAGLWFSLRGDDYVRPLNTNFYLQKPLILPASWGNGGRGGITIGEEGDRVAVRAYSGPRTLAAGDSLVFDVHFLITPFHPIDTDYQWGHRFYHKFAPIDTVAAIGANVVNVHHATPVNPYLNYPFIAHREMKAYVDAAHRKGLSVKIYDTVRELSNRAYETWAMRSLGHEIYSPGKGGGYSWLQEHVGGDYIAAWFVPELKDASLINSGMSRWHNYYVEGIAWLVKNVGIDGLYLDDVAFDRTTMKRVKRMLLRNGRPGMVDLHSANQYNERDGYQNSAVLYLEHFPYLNRLWFGEYFDYENNSPDFFLTEVSGIPFGLMGEMLEGGGNPWRGLLYGMTNRMPWSDNADPRPIWKMWDDFGIAGSAMLGYWSPKAPVRTDRSDVLATTYRRPGRAMVALASWATDLTTVALEIDWKALGIDPAGATITAPEAAGLQRGGTFAAGERIPVEPRKGVVLVIAGRESGARRPARPLLGRD